MITTRVTYRGRVNSSIQKTEDELHQYLREVLDQISIKDYLTGELALFRCPDMFVFRLVINATKRCVKSKGCELAINAAHYERVYKDRPHYLALQLFEKITAFPNN